MKATNTLAVAMIISSLFVTLPGCQKGPAEKAGESIDNATESLGDNVEDAGDAIKDSARRNN